MCAMVFHFPVPTSPRLQPTDILYAPRGRPNPNNTLTFITHTTPEEQRDLRLNWELLKGHFCQHKISLTLPLKLLIQKVTNSKISLSLSSANHSFFFNRKRWIMSRGSKPQRELYSPIIHAPSTRLWTPRASESRRRWNLTKSKEFRGSFGGTISASTLFSVRFSLNFFPRLVAEKTWVKVNESFGIWVYS